MRVFAFAPTFGGLLCGALVCGGALVGACVSFDTVSRGQAGADADVDVDSGTPPTNDAGQTNDFDAEVPSNDGAARLDGSPSTAADGGKSESGDAGVDAGPFANAVQIAAFPFNANTIVTTATGGVPLTYIDGTTFTEDYNDFPTASEATALSATATGLPDDAFFANAGSTTMPPVQLAWTNGANVNNTIFVGADAGTVFTVNIPPAKYQQLQLYATGTGTSTLNYSLVYANATTVSKDVTVGDWCQSPPAGEYALATVDRVRNGTTLNAGGCHIFAIDLNPDPTQTLSQLTFFDSGGQFLAVYGATAW